MQYRGFHIDTAAHGRLLHVLRNEMDAAIDAYAGAAAAASLDATLQALPSTPGGKRELLNALLDGDELARWQRTPKSGELSTSRAELNRAAHYPPIRELVKANKIGKLLETFGENWLAHVSPVTGRIHANYRVAGAASGRATCAAPNIQQIPKDKRFRELFVAPSGRLLVCADYSSMELRAAAHISGDRNMTEAFLRGDDLHVLTAARVTGKSPADVTKEERSSAKPVNFGSIYGQGARGLAASAWANYGIVLTVEEAEQWQRGFNAAFPDFVRWRTSHYQRVECERRIVIGRNAARGIGRIFQTSWLPRDQSAFTRSCNYPIQGACADAAMLALARIDADLFAAGIDGGPVAWLHDEIVIEVPEADAEEVRRLLVTAMTDAFAEIFPGAPLKGLVEAHIGPNWADAKEKRTASEAPMQ
jgi:DNA polymerase-1